MTALTAPSHPADAPLRSKSWNAAMSASPGALDLSVSTTTIDGKIPTSLHGGRLLSNGPGWTRIGDRTAHPFDGHGYLRAFDFKSDGSVALTARFVDTPSYKAEAEAQRLVHRGFATNKSDHFWNNLGFDEPRNVANTTIIRWKDRLLAGWEGGRPYALSPSTLETIGEHDFGGAIAGQTALAHMHYDATRDRLIVCSPKTGRNTTVTFREFDADENIVSTSSAEIEGMLFAHDYAVTPHWYVLGGSTLKLRPGNLAKMVLGRSTLLKSVRPDTSKPGALHLIPRDGNGPMRTIPLPDSAFVVHFGNAFERDGDVVVDACLFSKFDLGEEFGYTGPKGPFDPTLPDARGPQRLMRITVASDGTATWRALCEYGIDFPRFHPQHETQPTPVMFGATRADTRFSDPFDSIVRVDLVDEERPATLWTTPDNVFVGEPIFVPSPEHPDRGHILALLSDGLEKRTELVVLVAENLAQGPVARVPLPLLPIGFHGEWDPMTGPV